MTQDRLKQIQQIQKKRLSEEISQISSAISSLDREDVRTMPERVFVNIWLPFFADEKPLRPELKVDFTHWVNFVGSPYKSVQVVDADGKELFLVPPLFDRSLINPTGRQGNGSIMDVVAQMKNLALLHPNQGAVFFDKELTRRALLMKVPPNIMESLKTWNAIFARYGKAPLVDLEEVTKASQPQVQATGSAQSDYDIDPL
jgi:hypothetical protein